MIIRKSLVFILINICLLGKNWWYYKSRGGGLGQDDVMTSPPRFSSAPSKVSGFLTVRVEKANFY